MKYCKIEPLNDALHLRIKNDISGCGVSFIGITGLVIFILPLLTILFLDIEIALGPVLVCMLAWSISVYLIRLYLWNRYGEEVFIINKNTLETYNSYKYFRDSQKIYSFNCINILFVEGGEMKYINENYYIKDSFLSVIGFQLDEEIIISHKEISILDIQKVAKYLIMYRRDD